MMNEQAFNPKNTDQKNDRTADNEKINDFNKHRQLRSKPLKWLLHTILLLIPAAGILYALGIHQTLRISIYPEQYIGLFLGLILFAAFLSVPASKRSSQIAIPWYDWILALAGLGVGLYIMFFFPKIILRMGMVPDDRFIVSVIAILIVLEATRRIMGLAMVIIVSIFIIYAFGAPSLPGIFRGNEMDARQLFNYLYLDPSSMLNMLYIAATIGMMFILFGQVLLYFGGGDILNDITLALFGRFRGGPAKGSIMGSALVGSITGSPVTNVILTGSVTIPLMKKNGYTATQAGAIEAVASTGGSIMPPVMGIAAFIMADTLGVPYGNVAAAALIPALLFFACLFFQVDLIAGRDGIRRLDKGSIPVIKTVLLNGWTIIPSLGFLVYFLFIKGYTPQVAGLYASAVSAVFLSLQPGVLKKLSNILYGIFIETGKVMLDLSILLSAAGIIVGVTGITGLGFNIGIILASLADHGLLLLLVLSAILSVILGMGMPSVAAYALVAVMVAPTMVELGVHPLAAHLFVFYFAIISNFTPPIALSCFAAAPIAKESPHRIGFRAMQLGIIAYFVPFLFVYAPELLLGVDVNVSIWNRVFTILTAFAAVYLLSVALVGYLFRSLGVLKRVFTAGLAAALFVPATLWEFSHMLNIAALIGAILYILYEWGKNKRLVHTGSQAHVK